MTLTKTQTGLVLSIFIIILLFSYYLGKNADSSPSEETNDVASSTNETLSPATTTSVISTTSKTTSATPTAKPIVKNTTGTAGFLTYNNSEYGFTMKYPKYAKAATTFSTFHELGNNWRLYAGTAIQGKPVVSFTIFNIDQGVYSTGKQSYPLYYTAQVRVGTSINTKECYTPDSGFSNQKIANVVINGTTFKKFSTSDAAMMKYTQAESYRTIKNNTCIVIEQIKNGTSYRDELMSQGVTDATLESHYTTGDAIVRSFSFTR